MIVASHNIVKFINEGLFYMVDIIGIVYRATSPSGGVYIGITTKPIHKRKSSHKSSASRGVINHFYNAIRKYGFDSFIWVILECDVKCKDELCQLERKYIEAYDSFKNGYNMTRGGEGILGHKFTLESRQKMSNSKQNISDDTRLKMSQYANNRTTEHIENHRNACVNSDYIVSEDTKNKLSILNRGRNNSMFGVKHSTESKLKMSESSSGKIHTDATKLKMSKRKSGVKLSEHHKKMISDGQTGMIFTDERKLRISESKRNAPLQTCVHCGLVGRGGNMKRYHFDNCKMKSI